MIISYTHLYEIFMSQEYIWKITHKYNYNLKKKSRLPLTTTSHKILSFFLSLFNPQYHI